MTAEPFLSAVGASRRVVGRAGGGEAGGTCCHASSRSSAESTCVMSGLLLSRERQRDACCAGVVHVHPFGGVLQVREELRVAPVAVAHVFEWSEKIVARNDV